MRAAGTLAARHGEGELMGAVAAWLSSSVGCSQDVCRQTASNQDRGRQNSSNPGQQQPGQRQVWRQQTSSGSHERKDLVEAYSTLKGLGIMAAAAGQAGQAQHAQHGQRARRDCAAQPWPEWPQFQPWQLQRLWNELLLCTQPQTMPFPSLLRCHGRPIFCQQGWQPVAHAHMRRQAHSYREDRR